MGIDSDNECPVCLTTIIDKSTTFCGHSFCKECIKKALYPEYSGSCPICRNIVTLQQTQVINENQPVLVPKPLTIFGSIYIQGNMEGLASYHFDSDDDCYISYASPHCNGWPLLDDGSRPPVKKPFVNYQFNSESRTFTGDIIWAPTSWEGDQLWKYEMVFSENFDFIESGRCSCFSTIDIDATNTSNEKFGEDLCYKRLYESFT